MHTRPIAIVGAVALVALLGASPVRAQESVAADDAGALATNADRLTPHPAVLALSSSGAADSVAEKASEAGHAVVDTAKGAWDKTKDIGGIAAAEASDAGDETETAEYYVDDLVEAASDDDASDEKV